MTKPGGNRISDAGWSSLVARKAHNLEVVGSNPTPASKSQSESRRLRTSDAWQTVSDAAQPEGGRSDGSRPSFQFARGDGANEGDDGKCGLPLDAVVPSQFDDQHAGEQGGHRLAAVGRPTGEGLKFPQEARAHRFQSIVGGV